ncbi:DciA family protein [Streptomyces bottropensis]|uniref:DciA family protein n=1 Tax=Streptomyces bottropensis TaxID=42235 RepID=UPI0036BCAE10
MTDTPAASGRDLARQALAAYKASARTQPTTPVKKTRRTTRPARGEGRDPQGLGAIIGRLTDEQGWADNVTGGDLIDQWPTIAPAELATTVTPVSYDADRGLLTLRPSTPAYATQIRLFQLALAKRLNTALGKPAVRAIRVLPPGAASAPGSTAAVAPAAPAPEAPVRTRETASPGYRTALELSLTHRPERAPTDPYLAEAIARQDHALRAKRLPEDEHADYLAEQERLERQAGPTRGSSEASRQAALASKRRQTAGLGEPRRAFDVA